MNVEMEIGLLSKDAMNDLAIWSEIISDKIRIYLLDHRPVQLKKLIFLMDNKKRAF